MCWQLPLLLLTSCIWTSLRSVHPLPVTLFLMTSGACTPCCPIFLYWGLPLDHLPYSWSCWSSLCSEPVLVCLHTLFKSVLVYLHTFSMLVLFLVSPLCLLSLWLFLIPFSSRLLLHGFQAFSPILLLIMS